MSCQQDEDTMYCQAPVGDPVSGVRAFSLTLPALPQTHWWTLGVSGHCLSFLTLVFPSVNGNYQH